MGVSAAGCWIEGLGQWAQRIGWRGVGFCRRARRGERVKRVLEESPVMSEMGQGLELEWLVLGLAGGLGLGLAVEPGPRPSEDGPLPAERIRRSCEAVKCAAIGPVVGRGEVAPRLRSA